MILKPLTVEDYGKLKPLFRNQSLPLSVYSLPSLIVWSGQGFETRYTVIDDALIIGNLSVMNPEDRHLLMPVTAGADYGPDRLCDLARSLDFANFWYVPESYVSLYGPTEIEGRFRVAEQREFEDYIYLTEDLADLRGNRYSKKRNLIHQFTRFYDGDGRISVEALTQDLVGESIDFLQKWCADRSCEVDQEESLACEKRAFLAALRSISALEIMGLVVRVDGIVSALGIGSHLRPDTAVLNFEKAYSKI
jgi:hypothetical protein